MQGCWRRRRWLKPFYTIIWALYTQILATCHLFARGETSVYIRLHINFSSQFLIAHCGPMRGPFSKGGYSGLVSLASRHGKIYLLTCSTSFLRNSGATTLLRSITVLMVSMIALQKSSIKELTIGVIFYSYIL